MATARLIPSAYTLSNTSYLTISNATNMYANTDNTTYAQITHNRNSTTAYYLYIHGFNFSAIPSDAIVTAFTIKIRGLESSLSTSSSYRMSLYNNNTAISNTTASASLSTSATTFTFPNGSLTWATLSGYGNNFRIRVPLRRNSQNTSGYVRIYGAEIEVTYTVPVARTITTSLTGNGTIDPSGTNTYYDDDDFELVIEPTNASDTVSVTLNGSDITSLITRHDGGEQIESNVLGEYELISGGFNGSGASYFQGIVGHGYDTSSPTTSNYYSSGNNTQAVFQYDVSFDNIPSNAIIKSLYMMVNGHAESTSQNSEYMCVQLKSGSTALSEQYNFKSSGSTSNSTQTINATTLPTVAQLENLVVECTLGYYGGAINGVTVFLTYEVDSVYYTYSTTVSGDMTIAVTIGSSGSTTKVYIKVNGSWIEATAVYKKVNGSWVQQTDLTNVFDSGTNYKTA